MSETANMGVTAEELDDLAWALVEMFPEVARDVSPVHNQEFWQAKATQLLPVINKIREQSFNEGVAHARRMERIALTGVDPGREITLDEALEKRADELLGEEERHGG